MRKVSDTHDLLIVCGPTATGKTAYAVRLAKQHNGELINADSRQVYKGLDVISGKDKDALSGIVMWLYDMVFPGEPFSVSLYRKRAIDAILDIRKRGKFPIVVGGTGLYINAIVHPPETIDIPPDTTSRLRWNTMGVGQLQQELEPTRLSAMNTSDRNNPRRLIRALEIAAWRSKNNVVKPQAHQFNPYWIGLRCRMETLAERIAARVLFRWNQGALDEAKRYPMAVATGMKPMQSFLAGRISEEEAKKQWIREELAYAKRQITWFKKQKEIHWRGII